MIPINTKTTRGHQAVIDTTQSTLLTHKDLRPVVTYTKRNHR